MNWVASATVLIGKRGLELLKQRSEALNKLVGWEAQGEVVPGGYVRLHLPGCPEGSVWWIAELLEAFVMEVGPDSGGPGVGGAFLDGWYTYEVMPFNFTRLAEVYDRWKAQHPAFDDPEEGLEAVEAILEQAQRD
ncbi:hypothetical protein Mlute_00024 [Meiothermus luteus]|jgi:hypothetical protein|uniref:Uncharacterized protein n=1 Tax=Meiothermus luteus TaxID=2026184 RepID=A0A399F5G1_9DEIN|nr:MULTISPECIES: hypothetical protein [Meiothermus]MCL6531588.1 hypothetical protein [Meiothermus ruber]RIH90102.1 hypothetical protein Mlute_00024 [Meiothermus luteus]